MKESLEEIVMPDFSENKVMSLRDTESFPVYTLGYTNRMMKNFLREKYIRENKVGDLAARDAGFAYLLVIEANRKMNTEIISSPKKEGHREDKNGENLVDTITGAYAKLSRYDMENIYYKMATLSETESKEQLKEFLEHSYKVARLSAAFVDFESRNRESSKGDISIARNSKKAFLAGLLHDMGRRSYSPEQGLEIEESESAIHADPLSFDPFMRDFFGEELKFYIKTHHNTEENCRVFDYNIKDWEVENPVCVAEAHERAFSKGYNHRNLDILNNKRSRKLYDEHIRAQKQFKNFLVADR